MSWGHDEYLYHVVKDPTGGGRLRDPLPLFYAAHRDGAYAHLMNARDRALLPWVRAFSAFDLLKERGRPTPRSNILRGLAGGVPAVAALLVTTRDRVGYKAASVCEARPAARLLLDLVVVYGQRRGSFPPFASHAMSC
jgi:hypothetical protein